MPKSKMRILIWCPLVNLGGGVRLLVQLVHSLARQPDVELVRLAVPVGSIESTSLNLSENQNLEVFWLMPKREVCRFRAYLETDSRILGIRGTGRFKRFFRSRFLKGLPDRNIEQLQNAARGCDLVYVFWPHRQIFPEIDKPIICTFQDAIFFDFPEILGGVETRKEWERAAVWLHRAAAVVVSSNATTESLERHFGVCDERAHVIHHAILPADTEFKWQALSSTLVEKIPASYIVCPANIMSHKNHHNLLIAWSRWERRKECPLVLIGGGTAQLDVLADPYPESWQAASLAGVIRRHGLQPWGDIFPLGYVNDADVMPLIRNAKALIMPTLAEGGGSYPIEEALSVGVPVLCSDIPVLREHLAGRSARIGWFDPESPESILAAIQALFEHYAEYKGAAENAVNDTRPTWDDVAAQYVEVFKAVLAHQTGDK